MNMAAKFEQINRSRKLFKKTPIAECERSPSALIDLIILIAVIGACVFLIYPHIALLLTKTLEIMKPMVCVVRQELSSAPMVYGCLGLSIFTTSMAVLAITLCTSRKCGRPGCRGLQKAAEFDLGIETDERVENPNSVKYGSRTGLFELPRDYFRELESELKKVAPANGRAILVFRGRCGCCVGRMEVPGPKKSNRKLKK